MYCGEGRGLRSCSLRQRNLMGPFGGASGSGAVTLSDACRLATSALYTMYRYRWGRDMRWYGWIASFMTLAKIEVLDARTVDSDSRPPVYLSEALVSCKETTQRPCCQYLSVQLMCKPSMTVLLSATTLSAPRIVSNSTQYHVLILRVFVCRRTHE